MHWLVEGPYILRECSPTSVWTGRGAKFSGWPEVSRWNWWGELGKGTAFKSKGDQSEAF